MTASPTPSPASPSNCSDPRPVPPEPPEDGACCNSGCDPCVFDFYYEELERYRAELRAWEEREAARQAQAGAAKRERVAR